MHHYLFIITGKPNRNFIFCKGKTSQAIIKNFDYFELYAKVYGDF